ncbi:MAG: hypothetical protein KDI79_27050 [Anaerolineae bacterium]|nr:hypothetical protein [Anaerolineae bacterium]
MLIPTTALAMVNPTPASAQTAGPLAVTEPPRDEFDSAPSAINVPLNQRHPYAGAYPIWSWFITPQDLEGKYSFLKGQQLFAKWTELKPVENSPYRWDILDNRAKERLGNSTNKVLYLQVNAEWPDWVYKQVAKANFTDRGINPPQFWDPVYINIYSTFIKDLAQHIAQSSYKDKIVLVRAQYNALNPESITPWNHFNYTDYQPTATGHRHAVNFTTEIGNDYARQIVDAYLNAFKPLGITVVSKPHGSTQNERQLAQEFVNKDAGLFLTNSTPNPIARQEMLQFSKTQAKTRSFSEPFNSAEVYDNPLQWIYWQTLSDLHQGVEFITYYGDDVITNKYADILKFADKYAGWYREPGRSPGAWVAFRGVKNPTGSIWAGGHLEGNYEYLITQIEPDTSADLYAYAGTGKTDEFNLNPQSKPITNLGTRSQKEGIWARRTNQRPIYLNLNDTFASSLNGNIDIRVDYFDQGTDSFKVIYKDRTGQFQTQTVKKSNSGQWKEITFMAASYQFNNSLDRSADIVLDPAGDGDDIFHMVEITRNSITTPDPIITPTVPAPTNTPQPTNTPIPLPTNVAISCENPTILFIGETRPLPARDQAIADHLSSLGYSLTVRHQTETKTSDANGQDLILISDSINSQNVSTKFRDVTAPVLTWEAGLFDDMSMASQGDYVDNQTQITLTNAAHPLAAGLSGQVTGVTAPRRFFWGTPGSNAIQIATVAGDSSKVSIFAYETGTPMVGLTAPARRVGFFNGDGPNYTAESWRLFEAAVNWALNCETTAPLPTNTPSPANTPTPTPVSTAVIPSEAGTLMFDTPSSVKSGDTFAVAVVAKDLPDAGLYGVQLEIDYDPAIVSVSQLKPSPDLPFVLRDTVDNNTGQITFVASRQGNTAGLTGEVTLFTFQATAAGTTGTITFGINQAKVSDPQALPITMTSEEGTISVTEGNTNPTPQPTDQPTAMPTTAPSPEPTTQPSPQPTLEPEPTATTQPTPLPTTVPTITTIFGQVILPGRTNNNWANAVVSLSDGSSSGNTDASGNFSLTNVTVSVPASITADAPGYLPAACTITAISSVETGLASVSLLSGDINNDLEVDIGDATAIGASFGQTGTELAADINLDTVIDIFDLVLVVTNFGQTGPQEWICQ